MNKLLRKHGKLPLFHQFFRKMKLTILILTLSILSCFSAETYSQITKLTISENNSTLLNVLRAIEGQSEFKFFYNEKVDVNMAASVDVTQKSVTDILDKVLSNTSVKFKVLGRQIALYDKDEMEPFVSEQQQRKVAGKVTDSSGATLPGVSVIVKGTTLGVITDTNGNFSLDNIPENATLQFSFVGMKTQEVIVTGKTIINVTLAEETVGIEDVVVVGYGVQKKVNLTGSVTQVNSERLELRTVSNINQALQGVAPGLNITPNSKFGGEPGSGMSFDIRGIGSLSGGAPYVLVDGMAVDMNSINPDDVESISVLKDAASCAIYGARASYGVILITTKSGSLNKKMVTTYSNNFSNSRPTYLPGPVNSLTFANSMNEAGVNSGQNKLFSDATIANIIKYQADPNHFPSMVPDPKDPNGWGYWNLANGNTDWYDVLFKDWAFSQKHNLGITGGSKNANYYVGASWLDEGGKFNFANDKYQRYNLTSNLTMNVTDWLSISLKSKFNRSFTKYPNSSESATDRTQIFGMISRNWPNYPVYTPNGDFAMDLSQVPALAKGGSDKKYITDLWINPSIELKLTNDWKINADFSYNYNGSKESDFRAKILGFKVDGVTPVSHYSQNYNMMTQLLTYNEYYTSNVYSKYEKKIKHHYFSVLVGGQAEFSNNLMLNGWRRDLVSESVPSISTATGDQYIDDIITHWSTLGTFMRISYNYNEKYLLELNGRYDGSSRFQEGRRWGYFPSVSIGYNIWKEHFWEPVKDVVNTLKIRASYGSLGNQNVANYLQIETLPILTNLPWIMDGKRPVYTTAPSNPSMGLTWEESKTINFGIDAGLLNNRLTLTLDLYNRKTENMFGPGESLPAVLGTTAPLANNATLETKGVELSMNWKQVLNKDFKYEINLAFSDNKSIVTEYNNPTKYIYNFYKGQNYGEIWGYVSEGLFQSDQEAKLVDQSQLYSRWSAGDVKYKDLNNDGKITIGKQTVDDPGDLKVVGNSSPRYLFGINLSASYKWFDLGMFWQGVGKRDVWMNNTAFWGFNTAFWNSSLQSHNLDYWSPSNTDAYFPKPYLTSENNKNHQVQTRYLQDGSYIRLKNVQIGYTLSNNISRKIKMDKIRFYLSGENILTLSKMMKSFDPEANVGQSGGLVYPLSQTFSVGLNVTF